MPTEKDPKGLPSKTRPGGLGRGLPRWEKFVLVYTIIRCFIVIFTFTPHMATVHNTIR